MRAIAGRCIAAMAMDTHLGVWQRFLPRSEAPGLLCCLVVKPFLVVIARSFLSVFHAYSLIRAWLRKSSSCSSAKCSDATMGVHNL